MIGTCQSHLHTYYQKSPWNMANFNSFLLFIVEGIPSKENEWCYCLAPRKETSLINVFPMTSQKQLITSEFSSPKVLILIPALCFFFTVTRPLPPPSFTYDQCHLWIHILNNYYHVKCFSLSQSHLYINKCVFQNPLPLGDTVTPKR